MITEVIKDQRIDIGKETSLENKNCIEILSNIDTNMDDNNLDEE